jgi:hypothetical protein
MSDKKNEKPRKHGKFDTLCLKPYRIEDAAGTNSRYLSHLDGEMLSLPVNGQILKYY